MIIVRVYLEAFRRVKAPPDLFIAVPRLRAQHFDNFADGRVPAVARTAPPVVAILDRVAPLESLCLDRHFLAGHAFLSSIVIGFALLATVYVFRELDLLGHTNPPSANF